MNMNKAVSNPEASTNLIIIMGVSGSGKSTLAKALADHYRYTYLDGDDFHSQESRELMAKGIPLTDCQRAPWVSRLKEHLQTNAQQKSHVTLAFSGLKQKHRNELRSAGLRTMFLYLSGDKDTIQVRLNNRKDHFMAPTLLDSQFDNLENPLCETDVHPIEVWPQLDQVIEQAKSLVDEVLLKETSGA